MKICSYCQNTVNDNVNFCPHCGSAFAAQQTVYTQPQENTYYPSYNVNKPSLGLKITSMVLSITGFSFMVLGALYTLIFLPLEEGASFAVALTFALFFLPICIVGFALSNKCKNAGDISAFSRVGSVLGLIGIILSAVSLFFGLISLITF